MTAEYTYRDGSRLGRQASATTCPRCHLTVLRGLDAAMCALTVLADPRRLSPAGEVAALRDGRDTYLLDGRELVPRKPWNIPGRPPTTTRTVLAEHRCHAPVPDHWHLPPAPPAPTPRTEF